VGMVLGGGVKKSILVLAEAWGGARNSSRSESRIMRARWVIFCYLLKSWGRTVYRLYHARPDQSGDVEDKPVIRQTGGNREEHTEITVQQSR